MWLNKLMFLSVSQLPAEQLVLLAEIDQNNLQNKTAWMQPKKGTGKIFVSLQTDDACAIYV